MPSGGGSQRLARIVGPAQALRLLLLGEVLPVQAAFARGLISRVAASDELPKVLDDTLAGLRAAAPIALAYVKEAAVRGTQLTLEAGLRMEADLAALLQTTSDRDEGVRSFVERRAPRFEGR
jgi:enoyl-CoA hydratase/carnithine racemase